MSLYQELMGNNNSSNNIINAYKNTSDYRQLLMNLAAKNPNVQQIINLINQSGKTPKDLFLQMAKQKGVNPNEILNMFK